MRDAVTTTDDSLTLGCPVPEKIHEYFKRFMNTLMERLDDKD